MKMLDTPPETAPCGTASPVSARFVICERRRFDFSSVAPGERLRAVIAPALPCLGFTSGTLIVRLHEVEISADTELRVEALHANVTGSDPLSPLVADPPAAQLVLTSADEAGSLRLETARALGTHLQIVVEGRRTATAPVTVIATLTMELVLRTTSSPVTDHGALTGLEDDDHPQYATKEYVRSRGQNLVTNGTGLIENNSNFSTFTFDASEAFSASGSFFVTSNSVSRLTDEEMPVTATDRYRLSLYTKWAGDQQPRHYFGLGFADADGLSIIPQYHMRQPGTDTVLAQPLTPGDTTIFLDDASNWNNAAGGNTYLRTVIVWGYKNSGGYTYPAYTYSRFAQFDMYADGGVDFVNDTITLSAPFPASMGNPDDPNGTWPAGTAISNGSSGSTYKYIAASNQLTPSDWTRYEGDIQGFDLSGTNVGTMFPPGTASARVLFLLNRQTTNPQTTWVSNVEFGLAPRAYKFLEFDEQASMTNPDVGDGRLWVRSDAPNVPMFTDDAGDDHRLAYLSSVVTDHGALSGLSDDDHSIYALSLGTVADNRLIRTEGTGGRQAQQTPIMCNDDGDLSGVVDLSMSGFLDLSLDSSALVTLGADSANAADIRRRGATASAGGSLNLRGASTSSTNANGGQVSALGGTGDGTGSGGQWLGLGGTGGASSGTGGLSRTLGGGGGAPNGIGGTAQTRGGNGVGSGAGGPALVTGGTAGATGTGGAATCEGGPGGSTSGAGGSITVRGGAPSDGNGGAVTIQGRDAATATASNRSGGSVQIAAGNATQAGVGGSVSVAAGTSPSGTAGSFSVVTGGATRFTVGGTGSSTFNGAPIVIIGTGTGSPSIYRSKSDGGSFNEWYTVGGNGDNQRRWLFSFTATEGLLGQRRDANGTAFGDWLDASWSTGALALAAMSGGATAAGGSLTLTAGAGGSTSGNGGTATLQGGASTDGDGGSVTIAGRNGAGTNRGGGTVDITAGSATGNAAAGSIIATAGDAASGSGTAGGVTLTAGTGSEGSTGGAVLLRGGVAGITGNGGGITLAARAGGSTSGDGGGVTIQAGNATSGTAGSVAIECGVATAGADGSFTVSTDSTTRLTIAGNGTAIFANHVDIAGSLDVDGTIDVGAPDTTGTGFIERSGNTLGAGGALTVSGGDGGAGNGGTLNLIGGSASVGFNGGSVSIGGASGNGAGNGGNVDIRPGAAGASGVAGQIRFRSSTFADRLVLNTAATRWQVGDSQLAYQLVYAEDPGSTHEIDWNDGNTQVVAVNGSPGEASTTLTFVNPVEGARYELLIALYIDNEQHEIVYPSNVLWDATQGPPPEPNTTGDATFHRVLIELTYENQFGGAYYGRWWSYSNA